MKPKEQQKIYDSAIEPSHYYQIGVCECGERIEDSQNYCSHCGTKLEWTEKWSKDSE